MTSNDNGSVIKWQLLGEILISRHIVDQEQVDKALEVQKKEKRYIGEILVDLGFVDERDIIAALVVQCNFPYIAVEKYDISQSILDLVPKDLVLKYKIVPLDRVGNILSVVMTDPLDTAVKEELQRVTKYQVAPFIATKAQVEKAIEKWYK